jgi:hypothetical protein
LTYEHPKISEDLHEKSAGLTRRAVAITSDWGIGGCTVRNVLLTIALLFSIGFAACADNQVNNVTAPSALPSVSNSAIASLASMDVPPEVAGILSTGDTQTFSTGFGTIVIHQGDSGARCGIDIFDGHPATISGYEGKGTRVIGDDGAFELFECNMDLVFGPGIKPGQHFDLTGGPPFEVRIYVGPSQALWWEKVRF